MGFFDEVMQSEGGGGYIAQARYQVGYKSYKSGLPLSESFFAAESVAADAMQEAFARAKGADPSVEDRNRSFRLTIFKDSILNKDMTGKWQAGDRHHDYATWEAAAKDVLVPSLEENGLANEQYYNQRFWAQISFKQDPYRVEQGADDPPLVPYVVRVFSSQEEAAAAVGSANGNGHVAADVDVAAPEGFNPETAGGSWDEYLKIVVDILQKNLGETPTPITRKRAVDAAKSELGDFVPEEKILEVAKQLENMPPF